MKFTELQRAKFGIVGEEVVEKIYGKLSSPRIEGHQPIGSSPNGG